MANFPKRMAPKNALTPFKIVRAVLIGVALFSVVALAPVIEMRFQSLMLTLKHARDPVEKEVFLGKDGKPISAEEHALQGGYDAAATNKITAHSGCSAYRGMRLVGCNKYVTEHKVFPPHVVQGNFGSGKSTAKCHQEVEAYWAAVNQDEREMNGPNAPEAWPRRVWQGEWQSCANYDKIRLSDQVIEPLYRLDTILRRLDQGGRVTPGDRATVKTDTALVNAGPDSPQRKEFLEKVEKFQLYSDHQE